MKTFSLACSSTLSSDFGAWKGINVTRYRSVGLHSESGQAAGGNFFSLSVHYHDGKPAKNDGYLARAGVAETAEASDEHFDPSDADFLPKESHVDASGSFKKMESIGRRTRQRPKLLGGEAKREEH
ncbi:hypothetical protein C8J56DRAFT_901189 [Mycena floridula]|nr:hypothetical protein C8J56DRAFT_901189 [Mycena floridula]